MSSSQNRQPLLSDMHFVPHVVIPKPVPTFGDMLEVKAAAGDGKPAAARSETR
jgi:hypothetical protein